MTLTIPSSRFSALTATKATGAAEGKGLGATVKHMTGMLWYEMLSEMNKTGFSADALGTGSDSFQSMMLWSVAQNDFGKYDQSLTAATMRQLGGTPNAPAATSAGTVQAPLARHNFTLLPPADAPALAGGLTANPVGAVPAAISSSNASDFSTNNNSSASPSSESLTDQAVNFARAVWPSIQAAAKQLRVPAVALLAQSALETGWGASAAGNNLFGIKATGGEAGTSRQTKEMVDGVLEPQTATFRDYGSTSGSVAGYVDLIDSAYSNVQGQSTVSGFAQALQNGGYATDNNYAAKIVNISQSPMMARVLQTIGGQVPPVALN